MTRIAGAVQGALTQGVVPSAAATLLADLPETLRNLTIGSFLNGTVLDRNSSGLTLLQTPVGVFGVKTTVPLPAGSAVTLQVQSAGAQLQAIVLSVTPQAGTAPRAPLPSTAAQAGTPPSPTTPLPAPSDVDGPSGTPSTIAATVIGPSGGPVPPAGNAHGLSQALPVTPPAADAPTEPKATPTPSAPLAADEPLLPQPALVRAAAFLRQFAATTTLAPQTSIAQSTTLQPAATDSSSRPLPSGTQVQLRLVSLAPLPIDGSPNAVAPATGLAKPNAANAAALVSQGTPAVIVARTPAGQTIVDSPIGRLLMTLPRSMDSAPAGGRILIDIVPPDRPAILAGAHSLAAANRSSFLARDWSALKETMQILRAGNDPPASAAIERAIPKGGPRLAQEILSFIGEASAGGAKAWLGEAASRALERLAGGLVLRLDDDLREMLHNQTNNDANWRLTIVPVLDEHELRQIRFFERRKKSDQQRRRDESGRFVVECEQSEYGALQIDGLLHERRLDVILRSHAPLPTDAERDLLVLFDQSCAGLGIGGHLMFQCVASFPIHPLDEFTARAVQVSV